MPVTPPPDPGLGDRQPKTGPPSAAGAGGGVKSQLLDAEGIRRTLTRIAHEVTEKHRPVNGIALVGVRSRGEILAQRLARLLRELSGQSVPVGALDITLYRDDLSLLSANPVVRATEIPFDVTGRPIIVVDDVLFTGRTVRAAMDALTDLGRPESVELAVLIDRGHRELPIKADYVGKNLPTSKEQRVQVQLVELDGADEVTVENRRPTNKEETVGDAGESVSRPEAIS